ncbi:SAM-dependent methyltransferase [Geobacillus thermoleovorans CCB_US3_UF5]|uniref:SAM-dependent methyltransferase n=1 Tax=Geobacillus thermoleovorans CCB_US3_UF5 TaxID=1111068 RepID=A0ABM5MLZ8_GEOTH|nr:SAM-dependent methyltransferase [Geobacillus thermoleovorans CCB_US3_UF5]GAJ57462.1 hypothetical protein B23_0651 [Geobacillus thermoleovorans B23]
MGAYANAVSQEIGHCFLDISKLVIRFRTLAKPLSHELLVNHRSHQPMFE